MDAFVEVAPTLPPTQSEKPTSPPFTTPEIVYEEPLFEKVDTETWDSSWDDDWSNSADVFATSDPTHIPEAVQDDVEWDGNTKDTSQSNQIIAALPTEAAMKRMKKAELVALANAQGVESSGTKADIIGRLLA